MMARPLVLAAGLALAGLALPYATRAQDSAAELKPASSFDRIADATARSIALFEEAGKVIEHPRCVNCHPAGDRPTQGMDMHPHEPPVFRGEADIGVPGMICTTCHGPQNVTIVGQAETIRSLPGHPEWHVAPIEQAWQGKSLGEICEQIKDPARNGGKSLEAIVEHMAHDSLVGWGWAPGEGREPVPGTQAVFGELIRYWAETGAACPA
jgi:hypothetical protein